MRSSRGWDGWPCVRSEFAGKTPKGWLELPAVARASCGGTSFQLVRTTGTLPVDPEMHLLEAGETHGQDARATNRSNIEA